MAHHSVAASNSASPCNSLDTADNLMQPALDEKPAAPVVARPRCNQCGKTLKHLPLFLENITCQRCYGAERYQRGPGIPIGSSSLTAPVHNNTYTA